MQNEDNNHYFPLFQSNSLFQSEDYQYQYQYQYEQKDNINDFQFIHFQDNLENNFLCTDLFNFSHGQTPTQQQNQINQNQFFDENVQDHFNNYCQNQIGQVKKELIPTQSQILNNQEKSEIESKSVQKIDKTISKASKKLSQQKDKKIKTSKITSFSSLNDTDSPSNGIEENTSSARTSEIKKSVKETKNLVKDFSNAICKFLEICNKDENDYFYGFYALLDKEFNGNEDQIQEFKSLYVNYKIHMKNIQSFQDIFAKKVNEKYINVFLKVIQLFFEKYAIFYIYTHSKMSEESKLAHSKYIYKFLDGIQNPERFTRFK